MNKQYSYLLINFLTIIFPILLSFDKKVAFVKKWKFIWPGLFITGLLYLVWDYIFTFNKVWSFNENYIAGFKIFQLPLEEILFFITVPFSCIFIYECLIAYFKKDILAPVASFINYILIAFGLIMLFLFKDRLYSLVNFGTLLAVMIYASFFQKHLKMGRFYLAYLISLLPFYIVNGILTSVPIVMYNNDENMGFRIGSIPFEDHFYSMSLLLMNILFYEYHKKKFING